MLTSNDRLVRQMQRESPHFLVDDTLEGLTRQMNALTQTLNGRADVEPLVLQATVDAFDANLPTAASCTTMTSCDALCMPANGAPTSCAPARPRLCR